MNTSYYYCEWPLGECTYWYVVVRQSTANSSWAPSRWTLRYVKLYITGKLSLPRFDWCIIQYRASSGTPSSGRVCCGNRSVRLKSDSQVVRQPTANCNFDEEDVEWGMSTHISLESSRSGGSNDVLVEYLWFRLLDRIREFAVDHAGQTLENSIYSLLEIRFYI